MLDGLISVFRKQISLRIACHSNMESKLLKYIEENNLKHGHISKHPFLQEMMLTVIFPNESGKHLFNIMFSGKIKIL